MTWRDRIQEGSYRGAAFHIDESQKAYGRRNKVHEYPGRDVPWAEDLGRAAKRWSVQCFVVGDNYDQDRDALETALNQGGSGTLVHPYAGTQTASVETFTVEESPHQGGKATFWVQFVESGTDASPNATPDTQGQAIASAGSLQTAATTSLAARLSVANKAAFVINGAQGVLNSASVALRSALAAVAPDATAAFGIEQQIQGLVTGGLSLLNAPATLAAGIFAAVDGIGNLGTYAEDVLSQMVGPVGANATAGLIGFGASLPVIAETTPSRIAQATNQAALANTVMSAAAATAVVTVASMDFSSYDDAVSIRDPLADQLDSLATAIADGGDDDLADAVDDLRLAMIRDVTARGASLARLYAYTPAKTESALVLAQRLYGDATRADELVARNNLPSPLFVPGGVALEVLADA